MRTATPYGYDVQVFGSPQCHRHVKRVKSQPALKAAAERPSDDPPGPSVQRDGKEEKARGGPNEGDVHHPQLIGFVGGGSLGRPDPRQKFCTGAGMVVALSARRLRLTPVIPAARIRRAKHLRPTWDTLGAQFAVDARLAMGPVRDGMSRTDEV
ncbi:MAG: hypothetical protein AAF264_11765 [Pseudomonadota bacterium]